MLEKLPHAIGEALKGIRPGIERAVVNGADFAAVPDVIEVTSPAFGDNQPMPVRFTEDGDGLSPPIEWRSVPPTAAELVLLIEDVDSPTPAPLVHLIVHGLPARDGSLAEGALPSDASPDAPENGVGKNSFFGAEYLPPDPPPGHGPHRYVVQLFALHNPSGLEGAPGRGAVVEALRGNVVAKGVLVGTFARE